MIFEEINPGKVLPEVVIDHYWNKVDIRKGWQDENDTFISVLTKTAGGHYVSKPEVRILINGEDIRLPFISYGFLKDVQQNKSNIVINTDQSSIGFDFSGKSGSDFLVVCYRGIDPDSVLTKKERQALEKKKPNKGAKRIKKNKQGGSVRKSSMMNLTLITLHGYQPG